MAERPFEALDRASLELGLARGDVLASEVGRLGANGLVLGPGQVDVLPAVAAVTFAEELHRLVLPRERLAYRLDLFVDLTEEGLVLCLRVLPHRLIRPAGRCARR